METIDVNRKVLSNSKDLEITNEVIVPDVKPDIVNIIDTNGLVYINRQEISNGSFKLEGNTDATIIYLSGEGDTRTIRANLEFSFKQESVEIKENCLIKYDTQIIELNSKMLNERKVVITAKLKIRYGVYEKNSVKFYNDFDNIEGLQKQEEVLNLNSVIGYGTAKATIDEKINVDGLDIISEILKVDVNISNIESKMSYNKILAKGEANICILYLTEDGRIGKASGDFPVMSFIEIPNVKEDNICELDYKMQNIVLKINNNDDHSFSCQAEFEIQAQVFEKKTVNIVKDLYSLKSDLEYTQSDIELELFDNVESEIIKIDEKFEINEIKNVLDVDIKIDISNINSPVAKLKIYSESTQKGGLIVKEFDVPIMAKFESEKNYQVNIKSKEFSLDINNVVVQAQIEVKQESSSFRKISMIQDVKVKESNNKDDYSVIVYFVKPNDTIWKIAKKFKVSQDTILKINDLENPDLIYPGDKLYVLK